MIWKALIIWIAALLVLPWIIAKITVRSEREIKDFRDALRDFGRTLAEETGLRRCVEWLSHRVG